MATNGIDKVCGARLTSDTVNGLIYDTPRDFDTPQELTIKPKYNDDSAYAANRKVDTASEFDSADLTWGRYDMRHTDEAYLLGRDLAANGGIIGSAGDEAPYIGLLYHSPLRRLIQGTNKRVERYGIVYKAQFAPSDSALKTKQGKPDLSQTPSLSGTGMSTDWSYTNADGIEKHPWEFHIDTDDENCPSDIASSWWNGIYIPGIATVADLALSSSNPAANSSTAATSVHPQLTFNNRLATYGGIALLKSSDSSTVNITVSLDATGKIITITPTTALSASTAYTIVIAGLTDVSGSKIAYSTIKFTTATA